MFEKKIEFDSKGVFNFFPGSWKGKIAGKIIILLCIAPNFALDSVQNKLLIKGEDMLEQSNIMYERAEDYANDATEFALPLLKWLERQNEEAAIPKYNWWTGDYRPGLQIKPLIEGMVSTQYNKPFTFPHSTEIEEDLAALKGYGMHMKLYYPYFKAASTIVKWASTLAWLPIVMAVAWLFLLLLYAQTKERRIILIMLFIASIWNAILFAVLDEQFQIYVESILDQITG